MGGDSDPRPSSAPGRRSLLIAIAAILLAAVAAGAVAFVIRDRNRLEGRLTASRDRAQELERQNTELEERVDESEGAVAAAKNQTSRAQSRVEGCREALRALWDLVTQLQEPTVAEDVRFTRLLVRCYGNVPDFIDEALTETEAESA